MCTAFCCTTVAASSQFSVCIDVKCVSCPSVGPEAFPNHRWYESFVFPESCCCRSTLSSFCVLPNYFFKKEEGKKGSVFGGKYTLALLSSMIWYVFDSQIKCSYLAYNISSPFWVRIKEREGLLRTAGEVEKTCINLGNNGQTIGWCALVASKLSLIFSQTDYLALLAKFTIIIGLVCTSSSNNVRRLL